MSWKLKKNKRSFLLLEVLIAMVLFGSFMPSLLKDQILYQKQIKKLAFLNDLDNKYRNVLFNLYYKLYEDENYIRIQSLQNQAVTFSYTSINVSDKTFETQITLQRHDKDGKNYHISAVLEVLNLPFGIKNYKNNPQNFYIKKKL